MIESSKLFLTILFFFLSIRCFSQRTGDGGIIGRHAPPLSVRAWVNGEAEERFSLGKVYVIEFSATWCSPCLAAMPHLDRLSRSYPKSLEVISIFGYPPPENDSTGESYISTVERLLSSLPSAVNYAVAIDSSQRTFDQWEVKGIPCVYVVGRDGVVVWKGHPQQGLDRVVKSIIEGAFDAELVKKERHVYDVAVAVIRQTAVEDYLGAMAKVDALLAEFPDDPTLYRLKYTVLAPQNNLMAEDWLRWLLKKDPPDIDWVKLASDAWMLSPEPDFKLAEKTAKRALDRVPESFWPGIFQSTVNMYTKEIRLSETTSSKRKVLKKAIRKSGQAIRHCTRLGAWDFGETLKKQAEQFKKELLSL